jgi:hypothetical protein
MEIPASIPGEDEEIRINNYADLLFQAIEDKYPTAVIGHRLSAEQEQLTGAPELLQILDDNPDFDLGHQNIEAYLGQEAAAHQKANLKSLQRTYRLAPSHGRYDVMRTLQLNNLDSAQRIAHIPKVAFKERYGPDLGGADTAETVWEKARYINGMVLTLVGEFGSRFNAVTPKAIPSQTVDELEGKPDWQLTREFNSTLNPLSPQVLPRQLQTQLAERADLRELFGSLDFCQCQHCKSVYGPAAYFVDLLNFLKHAGVNSKKNALEALLGRRPDLAEVELSCENANTVMPYIDLVNEVLENALAWFNLSFDIPDFKDIASQNQGLINDHYEDHKDLRRKFGYEGYHLSNQARLVTVRDDIQWRILDGKKIYVILNQKGSENIVYNLLTNQTSWTQEDLSVLPEHLNEHAYIKLSQDIYPWNLPFDLWFEEARLYWKHLGFRRHEWMQKIGHTTPLNIACDYLGLTQREKDLITNRLQPLTYEEYQLWGLKTPQDYDQLRVPRVFLRQAGFDVVSN